MKNSIATCLGIQFGKREFNRNLFVDERAKIRLVPIADGVTLARKISSAFDGAPVFSVIASGDVFLVAGKRSDFIDFPRSKIHRQMTD